MDPNLFKTQAEVIHAERLRTAAQERRFRQTVIAGPGLRDKALSKLGGLLVSLGQWLDAGQPVTSTKSHRQTPESR